MQKTYKIDVDCANCANKMEEAAKATTGVKDATVNFMTLKMNVEFEDGADAKAVMQDVLKNCKKVEDDCEIFLQLRRTDDVLGRKSEIFPLERNRFLAFPIGISQIGGHHE